MNSVIINPTISMLEAPFWHEGMTYAEYEEERMYFYDHLEEYRTGKYRPLWKSSNNE